MELSAIIEMGALVFGLTEVLKALVPVKYRDRVAPTLAVLTGALSYTYMYGYSPENVTYGLVLGLAASGLYKIPSKFPTIAQNVTTMGDNMEVNAASPKDRI